MKIPGQILKDTPEFKAIFEDLHANPEIGFEEYRTAKVVKENLIKYGVDNIFTKIAETGVIGIIKGKGSSSRRVALRADMDALPIHERHDFDYKSINDGVMHACGHDTHMAILMATAEILSNNRDFPGTVKFIFQPAEEGPPPGEEGELPAPGGAGPRC